LRAAFFAWSAVLSKILTIDNLRKRHIIAVDKSVDHLPLHCDAYAIWIAFFNRFGLSWVMHTHTVDQYACWWTTGSTRSGVVWKMMYTCLLWCLRREMNYRSFKDRERTLEEFYFF